MGVSVIFCNLNIQWYVFLNYRMLIGNINIFIDILSIHRLQDINLASNGSPLPATVNTINMAHQNMQRCNVSLLHRNSLEPTIKRFVYFRTAEKVQMMHVISDPLSGCGQVQVEGGDCFMAS